ncbi:MAG: hypothetical protein C5B59_01455 [Bacteroidetes bacterium]|nr:MAG: hypothetical protein C5B59_01455 [Bacteroidota bacterium]
MDEIKIGEKLREERKRRKLTQQQLGDLIKISKDYVSRIEKGERTPSAIVTAAIDDFLSKNISDNSGVIVNGHNAHIDIHQAATVEEENLGYADPVAQSFLKDWLRLTDVDKMRVWTLVREKLAEK